MAETNQTGGSPASHPPDRVVWETCRGMDFEDDEAERFLDLAGFADARLDAEDDERDRVAALIAADPAAAADIAAVPLLVRAPAANVSEQMISRAIALVGEPGRSQVIPFVPRARPRLPIYSIAQWGSVAAALIMAGWLGFALGTGASLAYGQGQSLRSNDDSYLSDMIDPMGALPGTVSDGLES